MFHWGVDPEINSAAVTRRNILSYLWSIGAFDLDMGPGGFLLVHSRWNDVGVLEGGILRRHRVSPRCRWDFGTCLEERSSSK